MWFIKLPLAILKELYNAFCLSGLIPVCEMYRVNDNEILSLDKCGRISTEID